MIAATAQKKDETLSLQVSGCYEISKNQNVSHMSQLLLCYYLDIYVLTNTIQIFLIKADMFQKLLHGEKAFLIINHIMKIFLDLKA